MGIQDSRDQAQRQGLSGENQQEYLESRAAASQKSNPLISDPFAVLTDLDKQWSGAGEAAPHSYFEYFFTGDDVLVYIDGSDMSSANCVPIIELGFNIEQQKVPVYGFWDYTFSSVMRGTRLVSGVIRIATADTHYLINKISDAAEKRVNKAQNLNPIRGLDLDEENIDKYWTRNIDPDIAFNNNKHLFSAHPPFNLVVRFQMQAISVGENPLEKYPDLLNKYKKAPANVQDYNTRLVDTGPSGSMSYILENVELTSMQTEMAPTGDVIAETYSFFARDYRLPRQ